MIGLPTDPRLTLIARVARAATVVREIWGGVLMPDPVEMRARLEAMLRELEGRESRIADDLAEPPSPDSAEHAVEMEDDAALEGQGALVAREIASVKRALGRIEDGTYGECVRCGGAIADARLEARPEAALCIDCARAAE